MHALWLQLVLGACVLLASGGMPATRARFIAKRETSNDAAVNDPDMVTMQPLPAKESAPSSEMPMEHSSIQAEPRLESISNVDTSTAMPILQSFKQSSGIMQSSTDISSKLLPVAMPSSSSVPPALATPMKLHALSMTPKPATASTTKPSHLGTLIYTTAQPTASHENAIDEQTASNNISNSSTTQMRLLPEKRAKFISENSTNAQQLSWPNAAEVWSLAAMKAVPKVGKLAVSSIAATTTTTTELPVIAVGPVNGSDLTTNDIEWLPQNQTKRLSEKNLLDWQQIMMHEEALQENHTEFMVSTTLDATESVTQVTELLESAASSASTAAATTMEAEASSWLPQFEVKKADNTTATAVIKETTTTATTTVSPQITAAATTVISVVDFETTTSVPTTTMAKTVGALNATPTTSMSSHNMAMKAHKYNENTDDKTKDSNNSNSSSNNNGERLAVSTERNKDGTDDVIVSHTTAVAERASSAPIAITVSMRAAGNASTTATLEQDTTTAATTATTSTAAIALATSTTPTSLPIKVEQTEATTTIVSTTTTTTTTTTTAATPTHATEIGQISNEVNLETITNRSEQINIVEVATTTATPPTTTTATLTKINSDTDNSKKASTDVNDLLIAKTTATEVATTTTAAAEATTIIVTTAENTNKSGPVENVSIAVSANPLESTSNTEIEATTATATTAATTTTTPTPTLLVDLKATSKVNEHESSLETNNISENIEATADITTTTATTVIAAATPAAVSSLGTTRAVTIEATVQPNALGETDESTSAAAAVEVAATGVVKAGETKAAATVATSVEHYDDDNSNAEESNVDDNDDVDEQLLNKTTMATLQKQQQQQQQQPAIVTLETTTTTTAPTTVETPLISLLDDSTTTTTTRTTSTTTESQTTTTTAAATSSAEQTSYNSSYIEFTTSSSSNNMLPIETTSDEPVYSSTAAMPLPPHMVLNTQPQPNSTNAHGETDVNVIIAITVSVIGVGALILLVAFLYLMRKRQKQTSYGQRCRPVSMDAYSLDNVSVLGSVRRKGRDLRASKRTYGNAAFDDPSLRHNLLSANELGKFVERRSSIFEEFRDVPQIIARADEVPAGCEDKNRYANVIPLPETRVVLQRQGDDDKTEYINANYVRGPRDAPNYYVACQAPMESTTSDFWRMIWEQQSRVIIQATDLTENGIEKCAEYLPPSATLDNHSTYGDYQVTLKHREVKDKYAISTVMLKRADGAECRELTHYWYKWPEVGVPVEEAPIIAMLLEARSSLKSYAIEQANELKEKSSTLTLKSMESSLDGDAKNAEASSTSSNEINGNVAGKSARNQQGPLTIHCSPGTGRTGTIIACDMAIRSLETPKRSVDIPQLVYYVRRGRASAVQTKEQYEFIYKVANMYATKITNLSNDN